MANVLKTLTLRQKEEDRRQQSVANLSNGGPSMNRQESSELSHFSQQVERDRYLGVRKVLRQIEGPNFNRSIRSFYSTF